jgi:hypothetical protein
LAQTSTKRRNIIIVSIIIVVLVVSSIAILVELHYQLSTAKPATSKLDVTVSLNQTNVIQGNNLQAEVNVTSKGNPENITLSAYVGLSGIRCSFDPAVGTSNFYKFNNNECARFHSNRKLLCDCKCIRRRRGEKRVLRCFRA